MTSHLRTRRIERVTRQAHVRDFDQLPPDAKRHLIEATGTETPIPIPAHTRTSFTDGEIVNYTGYVRITLTNPA